MEEENEEIIEKVSTKACDGEELIFCGNGKLLLLNI